VLNLPVIGYKKMLTMDDKRLTKYSFLFLIGVFLATPFLRATILGTNYAPNFFDFGVFYQIGEAVLEGKPLYSTPLDNIPNTGSRYLYPPVIALLFVPFTLISYEVAGWLWIASSLIALLAGVYSLVNACSPGLSRRNKAIILLLTVLYYPVYGWINLGQITGFLVASLCFAGTVICNQRGESRSAIANLLIVLPSIVKIIYSPGLAYLLRDKRRLLQGVTFGSVLLGTGFVIFGIDAHLEYISVLRAGKGWGTFNLYEDAWANTYLPLYFLGQLRLPAIAIISVGIAGLAIKSSRVDDISIDRCLFALGVISISLLSPSPSLLIVNTVIPGAIVVILTARNQNAPYLYLPLFSLALIQVHPIIAGGMTEGIVQNNVPDIIYPTLYYLMQPAMWGVMLLMGFTVYRICKISNNAT